MFLVLLTVYCCTEFYNNLWIMVLNVSWRDISFLWL